MRRSSTVCWQKELGTTKSHLLCPAVLFLLSSDCIISYLSGGNVPHLGFGPKPVVVAFHWLRFCLRLHFFYGILNTKTKNKINYFTGDLWKFLVRWYFTQYNYNKMQLIWKLEYKAAQLPELTFYLFIFSSQRQISKGCILYSETGWRVLVMQASQLP